MRIPEGTILARSKREGWCANLKPHGRKRTCRRLSRESSAHSRSRDSDSDAIWATAFAGVGTRCGDVRGEILDRADKVSTLTKSGMTVFGLERTNAPVNVLVQVGLLGIEPPIVCPLGNEEKVSVTCDQRIGTDAA
jgi:hypothetical protein